MGPGPQADNAPPGSETAVHPAPATMDAAEESDFTDSLAGLARLSSAHLSLESLLIKVAAYAVQAIPGADGAGLTLLEADRADTVVKSEPFVEEIDGIQYGLNEGPCVAAAQSGETVRSGSLGTDQRWPRFGPRASHLGIHSALALPLLVEAEVVGVMNIYAHATDAFNEHAQNIGELFAVPAAIAVQNAQIIAQAQRLAAKLQKALTDRAVVDQAIGILISRTGMTDEEAFHRLRMLSQSSHLKVTDAAAGIVEEAARQARDRRKREHRPGDQPAG